LSIPPDPLAAMENLLLRRERNEEGKGETKEAEK